MAQGNAQAPLPADFLSVTRQMPCGVPMLRVSALSSDENLSVTKGNDETASRLSLV
jgi:hypothetical protein